MTKLLQLILQIMLLTPFKVGYIFNVKDPVPKSLKAFVAYKFVCPDCNAYYIGASIRHLTTWNKTYLETDKFNLQR